MLLALIWSTAFLFIRIGVPFFGPFALVAVRMAASAVVLLLMMLFTRRRIVWRGHVLLMLVVGLLNAALPYILVGWAELHITSGLAGILNATSPLFTALLAAHFSRQASERLTLPRIAGLLCGVAGVGLLYGIGAVPHDLLGTLAALAMLGAALSNASAAVLASLRLKDTNLWQLAFGQQTMAFFVATPFAVALHPATVPPAYAWAAIIALGVFCTGIGLILQYWLFGVAGPTRTQSVNLLIPALALLWGHIFLGEPLSWGAVAGLLVILGSVQLVMRNPARGLSKGAGVVGGGQTPSR